MLTSHAEVLSPRTLAEALAIKTSHPETVVLAGGTDLMVLIEANKLDPSRVLNLWGVPELRGLDAQDGWIRLGALTTWTELIQSPLLADHAPALVEAARTCGAAQIRNRGTLGGNLANASPAGDSLPPLLALDAVVELGSARRGLRRVPIERFFLGYRKTALERDELITAIYLPARVAGDETFFRKVGTRRAQSISKLSFCGRVRRQGGQITLVRLAFGALGPVPLRAHTVEVALEGGPVRPQLAELLLNDIRPIADVRSTAEYRQRVAVNVLRGWLESLVG